MAQNPLANPVSPEKRLHTARPPAIIVLMVVLFSLNAIAIYLRKRFERRW